MNAAFLSQWQLYRRGAMRPPLFGLEPKSDGAFDDGVAPGEIRVFADTNRPLVALVVEDRRLSGWRIAPVSPFCAPASDRELMVGERVLQLWNATVVSRRFASRSWLVDSVSAEDLAEVRGALAAAKPGMIASGDGVQAKYEREFLIGEGSLIPFVAPVAAESPRFVWTRYAGLLAASVVLCFAMWHVFAPQGARRATRGWRDGWNFVSVEDAGEEIELYDATEEAEKQGEIAEVDIAIEPPGIRWFGREPEPKAESRGKFADVRGPKIPEGIARIKPKESSYKSPLEAPMDVVFLSSPGEQAGATHVQKAGVRSYAAFAPPLDKAPEVRCMLEGGGSERSGVDAVLSVIGEGADGAKVTVMFDADVVEGYRKVAKEQLEEGVLARYELMAFAGREIGDKAVVVTLIWPSSDGDVRTPLAPAH